MSALFSYGWLIDTAAAVTLLIALVLLARGPVAHSFGPTIAYALWLLPLGRAVLPGITLTVEAAATPAMPMSMVLSDPPPLPVVPSIDWTLLLIGLWLTGALLLGGHAALAYIRLRRAIAADASLVDVAGRVAIVQSGAVDGPVAMGIVRPLVVLPRDFAALFTPAQQQHVIAHELEHHRGGDLVINLAAFALLALSWFNPIAWAGWGAFRQDQEAACDTRTLARTGGDRASYGRAIAVAVAGPVFRPAPAFALAMGEKSALIHRLRSLTMTDITPRRRWLGRTTLTAAALIALPLTASISYAVVQAEPPAPPAAPTMPAAPPAPLPPLSPEIDMTAAPGEHVRRLEHDGRTIILRTNRQLSDADVERLVAEAEASIPETERNAAANADATARRDVTRIVIRTHGQADAAMPVPPVPPVPPVEGERRIERRMIVANNCDNGAPALVNIDRRSASNNAQVRILTCGPATPSREQRLTALRTARDSLRDASPRMIADLGEARTQALTELNAQIAEEERAPGQ